MTMISTNNMMHLLLLRGPTPFGVSTESMEYMQEMCQDKGAARHQRKQVCY